MLTKTPRVYKGQQAPTADVRLFFAASAKGHQRKSGFARGGEAYLSMGENERTTSYMPGSNFAIVSASSRKGSGPGSWRMDS